MEKPEKKNKLTSTIISSIVAIVVAVLIKQFLFQTPGFDQALMKAASEINKTCPIMIDKETQLDNTIALPDNIFQYNYTLINMVKDSIDCNKFEAYMKPIILNNIKTNPDLEAYRKNKVTMSYCYKDQKGELISKISVTADLYEAN